MEIEEPVLKAELPLTEASHATTYYQLMIPVYIAEQDINKWIEIQKPNLTGLKLEADLPSFEDSKKSIEAKRKSNLERTTLNDTQQ